MTRLADWIRTYDGAVPRELCAALAALVETPNHRHDADCAGATSPPSWM